MCGGTLGAFARDAREGGERTAGVETGKDFKRIYRKKAKLFLVVVCRSSQLEPDPRSCVCHLMHIINVILPHKQLIARRKTQKRRVGKHVEPSSTSSSVELISGCWLAWGCPRLVAVRPTNLSHTTVFFGEGEYTLLCGKCEVKGFAERCMEVIFFFVCSPAVRSPTFRRPPSPTWLCRFSAVKPFGDT